MTRLFVVLLCTPLLVLPACDPEVGTESDTEPRSETESETESESTAADDADAFVAALADNAVYLCECSVEADGLDSEGCAEGVEDEFGDSLNECLAGALATDPAARGGLRCITRAFRDLQDCYESEGICPDTTDDESEAISDDACGLAAEAQAETCDDFSPETEAALDECFGLEEPEECSGDDC